MRRDLRGLSKEGADWVAAHLVAAGALADDEPELAWRHARAARARGGRIGVVRETVGLVAYRAGEWAEAIGELRAARRMGGGPGQLAVMADCERALGHPERAIELSRSAEADALDPESATELSIVVAGARADLGQVDTAIAQMERVGLEKLESNPRLAYAYADLLLKQGRRQDALSWFIRSADADLEEETDALERVEELGAEESADDSTSAAELTDVNDVLQGDVAQGDVRLDVLQDDSLPEEDFRVDDSLTDEAAEDGAAAAVADRDQHVDGAATDHGFDQDRAVADDAAPDLAPETSSSDTSDQQAGGQDGARQDSADQVIPDQGTPGQDTAEQNEQDEDSASGTP